MERSRNIPGRHPVILPVPAELHRICKGGRCGYVNGRQEEIIPCRYEEATVFLDGFAYVRTGDFWLRLNAKGCPVPLEEKNLVKQTLCPGGQILFRVQERNTPNGYGLLDHRNRILTPPRWLQLIPSSRTGWFLARKGTEQCFLDDRGNPVESPHWDHAEDFREGFAPVRKDGRWGYIDTSLKVVIPCVWEGAQAFCQGLAPVQKNGKWGYINREGIPVIPCRWESAEGFRGDFAWCTDNSEQVLLHRSGREAGRFRSRLETAEGRCAVCRDDRWGYVDAQGNLIVPCIWDRAGISAEDRLPVAKWDNLTGLYRWGFLDSRGSRITPCIFDACLPFREGMAAVRQGTLWGYIDRSGRWITPCIFTKAGSCSRGRACACREERWAEVTLQGLSWLKKAP